MKQRTKQILLALGSALGGVIVAALLQQRDEEQAESVAQPLAERTPLMQQSSRDAAINFLSDVLSETYRKVRGKAGDR